jgi:single-strand DNA-binding protein
MLRISIIGNLGGDPEMKYAQSGSPFLRFNVASNYRVRDGEQWIDKTEWVRCTVFGQRAETLSQYLHKGMRVFVDGRLEARPWQGQDGALHAGLEITANDVEFMSPRQEDSGQQQQPQQRQQQPARQPAAAGASRQRGTHTYDEPDDLDTLPF